MNASIASDATTLLEAAESSIRTRVLVPLAGAGATGRTGMRRFGMEWLFRCQTPWVTTEARLGRSRARGGGQRVSSEDDDDSSDLRRSPLTLRGADGSRAGGRGDSGVRICCSCGGESRAHANTSIKSGSERGKGDCAPERGEKGNGDSSGGDDPATSP